MGESMAQWCIEHGYDPCVSPRGVCWEDEGVDEPPIERMWREDTADEERNRKTFDQHLGSQSQQSLSNFDTAQEAFAEAKKYPGSIAKRAPDGHGFIVIYKT